MSKTVIQASNVGKLYRIAGHRQGEIGLRHVLEDTFQRLGHRLRGRRPSAPAFEDFWALRDVDFEVKQGDCVAVIGRNGAGKSTLLKILSRITEPTTGEIAMRGRVGSLLEVGTGFHQELTGRENIFLNGAILGMGRREILRKFDEIVAFSEVEKFLDTPVKHYSTGMYLRLAFGVAAHLEPEILIVDEVLAVGDAGFQKKCLGKMGEVSREGRTVLFVSHNMAAMMALCRSSILLSKGRVLYQGDVATAVKKYLLEGEPAATGEFPVSKYGIRLLEAGFFDRASEMATSTLLFSHDYTLRLKLEFIKSLDNAAVVVRIHDGMGVLVSTLCTPEEGVAPRRLTGTIECRFSVPRIALFPREYFVSVYVFRPNDGTEYLSVERAIRFEVQPLIVNGGMWSYQAVHGVARISGDAEVSAP